MGAKPKIQLISMLNHKGMRINFMITDQLWRIIAVKNNFKDRSVKTTTVTEVQAMNIIEKNPFIFIHL